MVIRHTSGFTLIELIAVILIVGTGLVAMASFLGSAATTLNANKGLQQTAQYAQECAERILALRTAASFSWSGDTTIGTNSCNTTSGSPAGILPPMQSGFTRTVTVTTYSGNGSPCPTGTNNCKNVVITVTNGTLNSSITLMLVDRT